MAAFIKNCERYAAFLYPNGSNSARINLYCADGYRLYLIFKDGSLQDNTFNESIKTGVGYQPIDRYSDFIDLVRNEKPVRVTFNTTNKNYVVYVSSEEVGEGEI